MPNRRGYPKFITNRLYFWPIRLFLCLFLCNYLLQLWRLGISISALQFRGSVRSALQVKLIGLISLFTQN